MFKMENQKSNQKLESQTVTCGESERILSTERGGGREIKKISELGKREKILPTNKTVNTNRSYITEYSYKHYNPRVMKRSLSFLH